MMGWLVQQVIASALIAVVAVKIFELVATGIKGSVHEIVKPGIFVGVWTAATTASGARALTGAVRNMRQMLRQKRKDLL